MGMMSLTLRIRFWSVNRYLAERKTGHLDAERAARTLETRLARGKATSAAGPSRLFARGNLTSQRGRLRRGPFSTPPSF